VGRLGWLGCLLSFCLAVQADALPEATNLWTFSFDRGPMSDDSSSTPAVGPDGTIYAGDFFGRLFAIAPGGSEQWRFNVGREIKSSPAVSDDGTIYFGARDHWLYALTPAGKLKWKFASGGWVDSSPAVAADGTVYFGSWDKNFYALHPDGSLKWKFAAGGIVDSSPAIAADGTVYFGAHNKKFYALDAGGKPRWTFLTGAEITSSPALGVDGSIYFSSTDGQLYRLKADGTEQWRCRIGGGSDGSPVLEENGNVVIAAAYKTLVISPAGATTWTNESPRWIDETPLVLQDSVCFSAPWKQIYAIRPDGAAFWAAQTWETPSSSLVLGNGGEIYVSCYVHLQAFQPPMALLPAKSSWPMFRANPRHNGRVGAN
jgi:outer membrane protein assembly factor BamB